MKRRVFGFNVIALAIMLAVTIPVGVAIGSSLGKKLRKPRRASPSSFQGLCRVSPTFTGWTNNEPIYSTGNLWSASFNVTCQKGSIQYPCTGCVAQHTYRLNGDKYYEIDNKCTPVGLDCDTSTSVSVDWNFAGYQPGRYAMEVIFYGADCAHRTPASVLVDKQWSFFWDG